jgi:lipopolysaccharide export system permease protein
MPIIWRYLLRGYFQFFLLCIFAFVAVLLVIRFQEIALFASSGAGLKYIGLFSLYQIPYILPIAIPVSCLIAAMILFQRLSLSSELTAMRVCGLGLKPLVYPLIVTSFFLSLINFSILSEITPFTRVQAKNLIYEVAAENPLIVLQKDSMLDLKTVHFDLKNLQLGKKAKEVLCVVRQASSERIGIFTAQELFVDHDSIHAKNLSILSGAPAKSEEGFDHLIIENQQSMQAEKSQITSHLIKTDWFAKEDLLSFRNLIAQCLSSYPNISEKHLLEFARRICLGLCPLSFTLIGIAFGTNIGRHKKKKSIYSACLLASCIMICFVACKTLHQAFLVSLFLYTAPQTIAIFLSFRSLRLSEKGVE